MNLELLGEAFHQNYPEAADGHLERIKKDDNSCATCAITLQFNRAGSLLAIGCNDGRVEIWDFFTRRIAKIIVAHVHPVCTLSWSRDSFKLASASTDNTVAIWDVLSSECERTFRLPCPLLKVQFNPRDSNILLVCPLRHPPLLIAMDGSTNIIQPEDPMDLNIVASFDRKGKHVYTGNSKGKVCIYDRHSLDLVATFRSTNSSANAAIKSIEFSRRGDYFLLNCADRMIRLYNSKDVFKKMPEDPEPTQKLKDLVNVSHWKRCCFSGDGEYVCAGSMKQHAIYMWERSSGTLVKILHGQKGETLLDVVWHPVRPIVVSLSNSITKEQVSIWAQTQVQNWSAFAPDFKELDENVEYDERESEFDLEDEDKIEDKETKERQAQDEEVDILTIEPIPALISSDEEEEPLDILMYLPIAPEVDNPEDCTDDPNQNVEQPVESRKRPSDSDSGSKPKRCKIQNFDIDLPGARTDECHPLLSNRRPPKPPTGNTGGGNTANRKSGGRSQRDRNKSKNK